MELPVKQFLENRLGSPVSGFRRVGGGSINKTGIITVGESTFFIKLNNAHSFPGMFEKEAKGLALIKETKTIRVPEVLFFGEQEDQSLLVMEHIHRGTDYGYFWDRFGRALAELHKTTGPSFGLDHDNYIGSLHQSNKTQDSFSEFFIEERLEAQFKLAREKGFFSDKTAQAFTRLYKALPEILPQEPPTLIHGDLWSGNFMAGPDDEPVLIDPAVCYAHREMDLAMTTLFGGFDELFYESYESIYPTAPGLESRIDIYNLYYLLVHVNLFGKGYVSSVESIINRF